MLLILTEDNRQSIMFTTRLFIISGPLWNWYSSLLISVISTQKFNYLLFWWHHTWFSKKWLLLCDLYLVTNAWVHCVCKGRTSLASECHGSQAVANSSSRLRQVSKGNYFEHNTQSAIKCPKLTLINTHMLHLCASEALLYVCCKLPFVSIKCPTCVVLSRKTNTRRALKPVVKARGNAGERRSWAPKIAVERSQAPHSR